MSTIFNGIHIALRTLLANQRAIQTVEHNVANANTPGYHRQEAVLTAERAYPVTGLYGGGVIGGQIGAGVRVETVRRFQMVLYDTPYRTEVAANRYWASQGEPLRQAESILAETSESGLGAHLDAFWGHWSALANDPSNRNLRLELVENAKAMAKGFSHRAGQLMELRKSFDAALVGQVDVINQSAQQVATLNQQIAHVRAAGDQPNDLLDERDRLLEKLAELGGAVAMEQHNGDVMVTMGGHALVFGTQTNQLRTGPDPANGNLLGISWSDGAEFTASRGEIAGELHVRDTLIGEQLASLNDTAARLISRVNALHAGDEFTQGGYDSYGNTGIPFFTGTDALSIKVNSVLDDPDRLAAASLADAPGDGSNAARIAAVKDEIIEPGSSVTLNGKVRSAALTLAMHIQRSGANARDHQLVINALGQQRESIVGVNLNEEAANLVKFQRSYEAAARLLTAFDEMADQVINRMGRVGL